MVARLLQIKVPYLVKNKGKTSRFHKNYNLKMNFFGTKINAQRHYLDEFGNTKELA